MNIEYIVKQIDHFFGAHAVIELHADGSGEIYRTINDEGAEMTIKIFDNLKELERFLNEQSVSY